MRLVLSSVLLGLVWFVAVNAATTLVAWLLGAWSSCDQMPAARIGTGRLLMVRLLPAAARRSSCWPCSCRRTGGSSRQTPTSPLASCWARRPRSACGWCSTLRGGPFVPASPAIGLPRSCDGRARLEAGDAVEGFVLNGLPGVSLAGVWRPRILVGSEARAALTPSELDLAISHEIAHRRSRDNLKRFLMYCAPDFFGRTPVARRARRALAGRGRVRGRRRRGQGRRPSRGRPRVGARQGRPPRLRRAPVRLRTSPACTSSAFHVPTLLEMRVRRLVSGSALPPAAQGGGVVRRRRLGAWHSRRACGCSVFRTRSMWSPRRMVTRLP